MVIFMCDSCQEMHERIKKLEMQLACAEACLIAISKNSCEEHCQEAALWAKETLSRLPSVVKKRKKS